MAKRWLFGKGKKDADVIRERDSNRLSAISDLDLSEVVVAEQGMLRSEDAWVISSGPTRAVFGGRSDDSEGGRRGVAAGFGEDSAPADTKALEEMMESKFETVVDKVAGLEDRIMETLPELVSKISSVAATTDGEEDVKIEEKSAPTEGTEGDWAPVNGKNAPRPPPRGGIGRHELAFLPYNPFLELTEEEIAAAAEVGSDPSGPITVSHLAAILLADMQPGACLHFVDEAERSGLIMGDEALEMRSLLSLTLSTGEEIGPRAGRIGQRSLLAFHDYLRRWRDRTGGARGE